VVREAVEETARFSASRSAAGFGIGVRSVVKRSSGGRPGARSVVFAPRSSSTSDGDGGESLPSRLSARTIDSASSRTVRMEESLSG